MFDDTNISAELRTAGSGWLTTSGCGCVLDPSFSAAASCGADRAASLWCPFMRKQYFQLAALSFALQAQIVFGHEVDRRLLDRRSLPQWGKVESASDNVPKRSLLAQSGPATAAKPAPQAGATTLPAPQSGTTLPAQRTETINYDNWILTCREFLEGTKKRTCSATVALQRSETGQTVLALTVQLNDQGRITASLQTPTGVAITPGIELKFDKAAARKAGFDSCEPSYCVANLTADSSLIRDASVSGMMTVVVQSSEGKPASFEFPIKGFDKAYTKMTKG